MNNDLMFSSKNMLWCTPRDFFKKLDSEFNFTLDPSCTKESALCEKYFTPEEDGLKQSWENERVFCNPPYGRDLKLWVEKAYNERNNAELIVLLIPSRTDTAYFHDFIWNTEAEIRFLRGRLKFIDISEPTKKLNSAPFPSMLVIYRRFKNGQVQNS
ncbi:MAG: adenine methyltransferase [Nanoarchaeota archaeon]|nr:adenine methyltransferase [Nanoarchaeota archaeon]